MEDLLTNDASFEVYANSEGAELLNNRVLMDYPSEKSSFQVFLGADGDYDLYFDGDYSNFNDPKATATSGSTTKPKIDPEKLSQSISAGATAVTSVASTIQAFKGDGTKTSAKRELKDVCGRRPLLKKKRKEYDLCVAKYNANKNAPAPAPAPAPVIEEPPKSNTTRNIIIGVVVIGVIATAFIGFKKGWFGKKAG